MQESLDKVLEDAVRMNDPFKVYTQMLQIYADSGKAEVWTRYCCLLIKSAVVEPKKSNITDSPFDMILGHSHAPFIYTTT